MDAAVECIKCVAIGDGFVGKTSLLASLTNNDPTKEYAPTIFDNFSVETEIDGKKYNMHFIDTAGQEDYGYLREQACADADIYLVCFSVTNMNSFSNVKQNWMEKLKAHKEERPMILIGTKCDLRNDPETIDRMNMSGEIFVSHQTADNFARSHNIKYVECSAITKENIPELLRLIVITTRLSKLQAGYKCCSSWIYVPVLNAIKRVFCCHRF